MFQQYCLLQSFDNNTVHHSSNTLNTLRVFNSITQAMLRGITLRGFIWLTPLFLWRACPHALAVSSGFLVKLHFSLLQWRVWNHLSTGSEGPFTGGWGIPCQRGRQVLSFFSWHGGCLPISLPFVLFGLAYHYPVSWVVTFVIRFTICQHQWALTLLPPPYVCVPSKVCNHITLPVVFTHPLWTLH